MLTKENIRYMAGNTFYARGVEIYKAGKVSAFRTKEIENGIWAITGQIKGSGRHIYYAELTYDNEADELVDSYCECPAYYNYDSLCKHCVAVLLYFVDYEQQHPELFISSEQREKEQKLLALSGLPETTPALKGLLMKKFMERTFPVTYQEICGRVRLEPYLELGENEAAVEFRIGISKMYVLKDVFTFQKHMMSMTEYSYGRSLKFLHMKEAFAKESLGFVEFILGWVESNEEQYRTYSYYGYSYGVSYQRVRKMNLDRRELEEFLSAVGEQGIQANFFGGGERELHLS
ncbi:MAG: SWIM zinc finger family protein, partial [Lachnospiraceae bacterium]|nr:SWIM zinc finger family protein [Lachnospiraceae bacterium]